jgi:hypothetical protein
MDKGVARLNIEHYRKLLAHEKDEAKRKIISRLLSEETDKIGLVREKGEKSHHS